MNVKEEGEERPLDLSVKVPSAASATAATAAAGKMSRIDKHRMKELASLGICDMSAQSSSSFGGLMMPAPFPYPAYMVPSVLVPYPFYPLHLYSPFAVPPTSIPTRPTPTTVAVSSGGRRSISPNHEAWKRSSPLQQHPQQYQHPQQHPQQQQQQQSQSKDPKSARLDPMANQHIAFKCACSRSFDTLYELSLHMQKTGHKDADQPSQVKVSKIVRGQEDWLRDQTNPSSQILKCLRCHESFVSLADLSVHMLQTQHFKTVVNEWLGREDAAVKMVPSRRANEDLPPKKRKMDMSQLRDDCSDGTDSGCQSETKNSSPIVRAPETKSNSHPKKEHVQNAHVGPNNNKEESVTNALLKMQQLVEDFAERPSYGYRLPGMCSNGETTTAATTLARSPVPTQLPKSDRKHANAAVSNSALKSSKTTNSELSIAIAHIKSEPTEEVGKNPLFHLQEMLHQTSNMVFKDKHKPLVRAEVLF